MAIIYILMTLIFGIGLCSVITGSLLPFVVADFPVGITITNIILGVILIAFSLGMIIVGAMTSEKEDI